MTDRVRVPMNIPGTFYEGGPHVITTPRVTNGVVRPFMVPLIEALLRKHPTWQFVTRGYGTVVGGACLHSRFTILEHGDELGWVDREKHWRSGVESYVFDNHRLSAKRSRGAYTKTKDLKKALKLINENIYGLTLSERTKAFRSKAENIVSTHSYRVQRGYTENRTALADAMVAFVIKHWEEFAAIPLTDKESGARQSLLDSLERYRGMLAIEQSRIHDRGAVLFNYGDQYYVQKDTATDQQAAGPFTLDYLSSTLKTALAMLRLVPVGEMVDYIGMRIEDNLFYVADINKED